MSRIITGIESGPEEGALGHRLAFAVGNGVDAEGAVRVTVRIPVNCSAEEMARLLVIAAAKILEPSDAPTRTEP